MRLPEEFDEIVYEIVSQIPYGKVLSYGEIARLAGLPRHSRSVGRAMRRAPTDRSLPCHRVVNSTGRTAPGWPDQRKRLEAEGVTFHPGGTVRMRLHHWTILPE